MTSPMYEGGQRLRITMDAEVSRAHAQPPASRRLNVFVDNTLVGIPVGPAVRTEPLPALPPDATAGITPEIAGHVLHHFGADGGWPASGFKTQLMVAIATADVVNRELLARGFPGYVAAFNLAQMTEHGTATLQGIAGSDA